MVFGKGGAPRDIYRIRRTGGLRAPDWATGGPNGVDRDTNWLGPEEVLVEKSSGHFLIKWKGYNQSYNT